MKPPPLSPSHLSAGPRHRWRRLARADPATANKRHDAQRAVRDLARESTRRRWRRPVRHAHRRHRSRSRGCGAGTGAFGCKRGAPLRMVGNARWRARRPGCHGVGGSGWRWVRRRCDRGTRRARIAGPDAGHRSTWSWVRMGALLRELEGGAEAGDFGGAVGAVDIDGDGRLDVIVGDPLDGTGGVAAGAVWGVLGVRRAPYCLCRPERRETSSEARVSGLGDFDGDGYNEFAIGVPLDDTIGSGQRSRPRHLRTDRDSHVRAQRCRRGRALRSLRRRGPATSTVTARPDLIVGAPLADGNGVDSGAARVFSGADGRAAARVRRRRDRRQVSEARCQPSATSTRTDMQTSSSGAPGHNAGAGEIRVFSGLDGSLLEAREGSRGERGTGNSLG